MIRKAIIVVLTLAAVLIGYHGDGDARTLPRYENSRTKVQNVVAG